MRANYAYVLAKCRELCNRGRVLDYGCGNGDIVEAVAARGIDIQGVEAFYEGNRARQVLTEKGLLGKLVFELEKDGTIPFEDGSFSLVVSNQVFEHVKAYMRLMRAMGFGYHTTGIDQAAWSRHKISFLDRFTSYRTYQEILRSFGKVTPAIEDGEPDYIAFRLHLKGLGRTGGLIRTSLGRPVARFLCRRLVGLVLLARKPEAN